MAELVVNAMRTPEGDAACRQVGIDPDANPATAALAALMAGVPEARYLARVLPPERRGCTFPGRFDREDNARHAGLGPKPGEGGCDYPHDCPAYGGAHLQRRRAMTECCIADCPAWRRPAGCGYLAAGTPCGHPRWRDAWRAAQAVSGTDSHEPARVLRRVAAAQRPLSPARALQLALQLEVEQ